MWCRKSVSAANEVEEMIEILQIIAGVCVLTALPLFIVLVRRQILRFAVCFPLVGIAVIALALGQFIKRSGLDKGESGFWISEVSHILWGILLIRGQGICDGKGKAMRYSWID